MVLGNGSKFRHVRERSHSQTNLRQRRTKSDLSDVRSVRTMPIGFDGACDEDERRDSGVGMQHPFGVKGWMPIMEGIRERIAGLRERANTAPARVESGSLTRLRGGKGKR